MAKYKSWWAGTVAYLTVKTEMEKVKTESSLENATQLGVDPRPIMRQDAADGARNLDAVKAEFKRG